MKTALNSTIEVKDTKFLTFTDLSVYNTDIEVTNPILRIVIPNFNRYVDISYTPSTVMNINSNLLYLSAVNTVDQLLDLPSGLYTITQSICPNDKVYYTYHFLNITPELHAIAQSVCCHSNYPRVIEELWQIKCNFEVAKILAESCASPEEGVTLFNIACDQLQNLRCSC